MSDTRISLILMALVYVGIFILIGWAWFNQWRAAKSHVRAVIAEHQNEKLKNENEIGSMPDDKLVELANERNRRVLSAGHNPKKK